MFVVKRKATIKELTKSADKHECTESGDPGVEESGTEEHKTATVNDLESANVTENVEIIEPDDVWSRESLLKESKKFNIDLAPKVRFYVMCTKSDVGLFCCSYILQEATLSNF